MDSIDSLIKAANAADATAKAYRTVSNSAEFRDAANKANEANEQMAKTTDKVVEAQKGQSKAQQTIITLAKETNTAWRSTIGTMQENIRQNERYKKELQQVQAEIKQQIKLGTDVHGNLREVSSALVEARQREYELKQAISDNNITLRQQTKEMQAAEGSMKQTSITLGLMKQAYRELSEEQKQSDFGKILQAQIVEIDESMKQADGSIGNFFRNVGDYKNKFSEAFDQVLSGNTKGAIDTLNTSFKGLVASARAFIASPIGIAVAALAAIGLTAKAVWDYNEGIKENIRLTEQFTGTTGQAADAIRQQAQAMTDTFGGDFKENLNAAQKLVKAFGITYEEAFDQVAKGLADGGMANEEFFDSINEYPQLFAKAGYSAEEFISLVNTGFAQGLFSDKLVDGIKEADLSLREQTKSTRDALTNAFGSVWTDDLLRRIKVGETTTKDALLEISRQAQETGLNQQQLAQITADVFRGAGEDAGGAAKFFDIFNDSVGNLGEPLSETGKHLMALKDANVELQQAMDSALKSDSVINFSQQWDLAWVKLQTGFFEVIGVIRDAYEWFWRISGRSETLGNIWNSLTRISDKIQAVIEYLSVTFGRIGEQLGITTEDSEGFMKSLIDLFDPVKMLEVFLDGLVQVVEFVAAGFINTATYAEALGRTFGQLTTFDFSNLKGIGGNAEDIKKENAEYAKRVKATKDVAAAEKFLADTMEGVNNTIQARIESEKEAERERKAAAEKAAKENEKLQKKYAADQKKAADKRKRLAEEQAREEIAMSAALVENFKLTQEKKLEFNKSFTLQSIFDYQKYLDTVFDMEKKHAEKVAGISYEDALAIDVSKRTSDQQKLINYVIGLEKYKANELKKINKDLADYMDKTASDNFDKEVKRLGLDKAYKILNGEEKKKAEQEYNDQINALTIKRHEFLTGLSEEEVMQKFLNNETLTEEEQKFVDDVIGIRQQGRDKEKEAEEEERDRKLKGYEDSLAFIGEQIGAEKEMRDAFEAYKKVLKAQDVGDTKAAEEGKLEIVAAVANAASTILGQQSAFGKALAITAAAINTYLAITRALVEPGGFAGVALAAVIGVLGAVQIAKIATQKPPEPPKFSASFATGVINSDFAGNALVDEEGPELHFDKYGKLKFSGKNRPNIRKVAKGDTILPAPVSQKIKEISNYNPVPDIMTHLDFRNVNSGNDYRFEKLESRVDEVRKAINKKPNYVFDGKNIIEVSGGNGSSHQRAIPKFGKNDKPIQETLK